MALKRVPGVRGYMADDSGFKQVGRSSKMSAAMVEYARDVAAVAQSAGKSEYDAKPVTVTAGHANERRAGAVAYESKYHPADWRDAILKRTAAAMGRRVR